MGRRAEPSREASEKKTRGRLAGVSRQSNATRPRLPVPLPLLPLPHPLAQPFRPAHWLGAFGDGEGEAQLVSWWWREFERGAQHLRSAFPDPCRPAPVGSRQLAGPEPAGMRTRPFGWGLRYEKGGHTQCF